jgi:hypothetical protein
MTEAGCDGSRPASWRSLYRFLGWLLLGLLGVDALVWATRECWRQHSPDDYRERLHSCRQRPRDLICLGGSPVSEGIDPLWLVGVTLPDGSRCVSPFNLGLPGGTTSEFWHALRHGAIRPPKLIVYGITASDLNDRRQEPHGAYSLMDWDDLASWVWARPESAEYITRHFVAARLGQAWQLFRYRDGIRMALAEWAERACPGCCPAAAEQSRLNRDYAARLRRGDGFAPNAGFRHRRYDQFKAAGGVVTNFGFLDGYRLTGGHSGYLHRILDYAQQHDTAVVLLDMPVTEDLERRYPQAFEQYRSLLAALVQQRGVTLLCGHRDAVGLGDAHFADLIHLNQDGADRLSAWLRDQLQALGQRSQTR